MKTLVEGSNLPALRAQAAQHYAAARLELPDRLEDRVLHIHDSATGRNTTTRATASILGLAPLRLRYTTQTVDDHLLEAVVLASSGRDALRIANALVRDFGVPTHEILVVREGKTRFHVTAAGPFRGLHGDDAKRLLSYLTPQSFFAPNGQIRTRNQQYYQETFDRLLVQWHQLAPVQLADHVRRETPLGNQAERIAQLFTDLPTIGALAKVPGLLEHLRRQALRATFPPFDLEKTTKNPLVPVPGSIWLPAGVVAEAIRMEA